MNISRYLEHWRLTENPFAAEEARHDGVFARLAPGAATHPDFEKILGDLSRPATSIVFGEKGSGKTAIRMQIAQRLDAWNQPRPGERATLISYDNLNPVLDRYWARMQSAGVKTVDEALKRFSLADHMDAILGIAVGRIVDSLFARRGEDRHDGREWLRALRHAEAGVREDMLMLQAVYDRPSLAPQRTARLRRTVRAPINYGRALWTFLAALGWVAPVALAGWLLWRDVAFEDPAWLWGVGGAAAAWALVLVKRAVIDTWRLRSVGRKLARRIRVTDRSPSSYAESIAKLRPSHLTSSSLPLDGGDEARYEMFARLRRVYSAIGFSSAIIVLDRLDEPTIISGDPDRMRAVVWPMLSSKFLQIEGFGLKLLLPIELRHALFRESSAFFQEARLDKQNLVEQLSWTGATLYDLCTARLRACRENDSGPLSLTDMFDDDVQRQDVIDALDQMRQPRDAFKLLYQCIQEHCANVTEDAAVDDQRWRIPRLVLDSVRRQQSDRVQQLYRGMRPA